MFILDSLLIGGLRFVLDKVVAAAETEMNDDTRAARAAARGADALELGEMTQEEFAEIEADILVRHPRDQGAPARRRVGRHLAEGHEGHRHRGHLRRRRALGRSASGHARYSHYIYCLVERAQRPSRIQGTRAGLPRRLAARADSRSSRRCGRWRARSRCRCTGPTDSKSICATLAGSRDMALAHEAVVEHFNTQAARRSCR